MTGHRFTRSKLDEGVQVRDLRAIVADANALEALEQSGYSDAMLILSREQPELTSRLFRLIHNTARELEEASAGEIRAIKGGDQARLRKLKELYRALSDLANLAGISLSD